MGAVWAGFSTDDRRSSEAGGLAFAVESEGDPGVGAGPGALPWWRLGRRPPRSESEFPDETGRIAKVEAQERRLCERSRFEAGELLRRGGELLGVGFVDLAGRGKAPEVVRARELLTVLGVERYGPLVKGIAAALARHPATATGWVMPGVQRRHECPEEAARLEELDQALSQRRSEEHSIHVPGTFPCRQERRNGVTGTFQGSPVDG